MKKDERKRPDDLKDDHLNENFEYPPNEDIYNNSVEINLDPTNLEGVIEISSDAPQKPGNWNESGLQDVGSGDDLDVPGAELDDENEMIGAEDEENNYYSLGGDNHINLEENDADVE